MPGGRWLCVSHIPGNVLAGNFRVAVYVDDGTSDVQEKALLDVYTGKLGGPIADFAKLIGEVVSIERAPIVFDVKGGSGTLTVGTVSHAELEPYRGPDGSTTVLANTIFSTVPGAPVFVGKATRYRSKQPALGHDLDMTGHNALQSTSLCSTLNVAELSGGHVGPAPTKPARPDHGGPGRHGLAYAVSVGAEPLRPLP